MNSINNDLPKSISDPVKRIGSKMFSRYQNKADHDESVYEVFDALEEILNAPEADRRVLVEKHPFLNEFLIGNLREDSLKVAEAMKKVSSNDTIENEVEVAQTLNRLYNDAKTDLLNYFENRKPVHTLPENVDKQVTEELDFYYDMAYAAGAQIFKGLVDLLDKDD
jgi:hypothetical protein